MTLSKPAKRYLKLKAPAKLNLYLEVLDKRPDGYHNIRTIFEKVSLADEIIIRQTDDSKVKIKSDSKDIPEDSRNLAYKAASLLKEDLHILKGVSLQIKKRIPVGAGLGGGSSDAASALLGLNRLWNLKLSKAKLTSYAAKLGSDVAFFLSGASFALGSGRGEKLKPWNDFKKKLWHILVVPDLEVSTQEIYREFDSLNKIKKIAFGNNLMQFSKWYGILYHKNNFPIDSLLFNRLEEATFRLYPQVKKLKESLRAQGVKNTLMSGSGGAVFGIVDSRKEGLRVAKKFSHFKDLRVFVVKTM